MLFSFHLKKLVNELSIEKILGIISVFLLGLFLCGFFYFILPLGLELHKGRRLEYGFKASPLQEKFPKQKLQPKSISNWHSTVAEMFKKMSLADYEIVVGEVRKLYSQCFYYIRIEVKSDFSQVVRMIEILRKSDLFLASLMLEKSDDKKLQVNLGVMGFCEGFCVCNLNGS